VLATTALAGPPQYKASLIAALPDTFTAYQVGSFTTSGAMTYLGGNKRYYFDGTNVIDLKTRWTGSIGAPLVTNDRGQFLLGTKYYRENIDGPLTILQAAGDWAVTASAVGMTNNHVFGSQYVSVSDNVSEAWYYNTVSKKYGFVDPGLFHYTGGEIMAMNDSGLMAIRLSHSIYGQGPNLDYGYLIKDGQKLADFGHMSEAYLNAHGQLLGQDIWDVSHFKFWDGTQLHEIASSAFGEDYRASGLSDDGTCLLREFSVAGKHAIYKDGTFYKFQDVCPGLPPTMNFYGGKMRADGAIAAFGRENGMSYLYRLEPVPEPASLAALSVGLLALARRRRAASPR
jgi:hypothetical protein